jgi:soluble lytic murein transglycosylase-like protein
MRHPLIVALAGALALTPVPPAAANVGHTVAPGETLWSIAVANDLPTATLAAANGLPATAQVVAGRTIWIPSGAQVAGGRTQAAAGAAPAPPPLGAYTVRPGDTLTAIAARSGIGVGQLAWMNGLDPSRPLLAGTPLKLPTGAPQATPAAPARPASPAATPKVAPLTTPERVSPATVAQVAAAHGVPASLAQAIARQESGFNNALVSSANARGVMQILPGTWEFVQRNLAGSELNPASAYENVHAGVMYLGQLLHDTGGDQAAATAAYYQGLGSVRRSGFLPETRRYVADVMAQRRLYGGP